MWVNKATPNIPFKDKLGNLHVLSSERGHENVGSR